MPAGTVAPLPAPRPEAAEPPAAGTVRRASPRPQPSPTAPSADRWWPAVLRVAAEDPVRKRPARRRARRCRDELAAPGTTSPARGRAGEAATTPRPACRRTRCPARGPPAARSPIRAQGWRAPCTTPPRTSPPSTRRSTTRTCRTRRGHPRRRPSSVRSARAGRGRPPGTCSTEVLPGDAAPSTRPGRRRRGPAQRGDGCRDHRRSLGVPTVVDAGPSILAVAAGTRLLLDGDAGTVASTSTRTPRASTGCGPPAAGAVALERDLGLRSRGTASGSTFSRTWRHRRRRRRWSRAPRASGSAHGVPVPHRDELPGEDEQAEAYVAVARELAGARSSSARSTSAPTSRCALPKGPKPTRSWAAAASGCSSPGRAARRATARRAADRGGASGQGHVPDGRDDRRGPRGPPALDEARRARIDPPLEVGVMVEVPAVAVDAERFARELDFPLDRDE